MKSEKFWKKLKLEVLNRIFRLSDFLTTKNTKKARSSQYFLFQVSSLNLIFELELEIELQAISI